MLVNKQDYPERLTKLQEYTLLKRRVFDFLRDDIVINPNDVITHQIVELILRYEHSKRECVKSRLKNALAMN